MVHDDDGLEGPWISFFSSRRDVRRPRTVASPFPRSKRIMFVRGRGRPICSRLCLHLLRFSDDIFFWEDSWLLAMVMTCSYLEG